MYESLLKIYYKNPKQYEQIYQSRFCSEASMHFNFLIHDQPAFLFMCPEIIDVLVEIYKKNSQIQLKKAFLPNVAIQLYMVNQLKDEILLTNEIEGVKSTRKEIETAIHSQGTNKKVRFKGLVEKYFTLIQSNTVPLYSSSDIRKLYDALVGDEIDSINQPDGRIFRKDAVQVVSATQKEKHRGIMSESKIIENMDQLLSMLKNGNINSLIRVSLFHYFFGYIHPFYDGNGRISRFISSYLIKDELDPLVALKLSYTIKDNMHKYYKAFDTCNNLKNKGDITPFVLMFLHVLKESTFDVYSKICEMDAQLKYYEDVLMNLNIKNYQKECLFIFVQSSLYEKTDLSIQKLVEISKKGLTSTRKVVRELVSMNYLIQKKKDRMYVYSLNLV